MLLAVPRLWGIEAPRTCRLEWPAMPSLGQHPQAALPAEKRPRGLRMAWLGLRVTKEDPAGAEVEQEDGGAEARRDMGLSQPHTSHRH